VSTPFLYGYASALVARLIDLGRMDIAPGRAEAVVLYLADYLHERGRGGSLISQTGIALLACDDVDELYADDDELKDLVETLVYGS
jgi:hypothetical protein